MRRGGRGRANLCVTPKSGKDFYFPGGSVVESFPFGGHSSVDNSGRGSLGDPGRAVGVLVYFRVVPLLLAMASKCGRGGCGCGAAVIVVRGVPRRAVCASLALRHGAGDCSWFALPRGGWSGHAKQSTVQLPRHKDQPLLTGRAYTFTNTTTRMELPHYMPCL